MSPHRSGGRGTFILDRTFPGVGRISRASGTTDTVAYQELNALLTRLWRKHRLDLLQAVREGRLHPLALLEQADQSRIEHIPAPDVLPLVADVYESWADGYDASVGHRGNLKSAFRGILRVAGERIRLGDLPGALRVLKKRLAEHPAMFNRSKAAVQAYLSDQLGSDHALYAQVAAIKQVQEKPHRRRRPSMLPKEFGERVQQLCQPYTGMAWTLALTGMEPQAVYLAGQYAVLKDRVRIIGQKVRRRDERREREVPRVGELLEPGSTYKPFRLALASVGLQPYDLRHLYAHWLNLAGVRYTDIQRYLGHEPRTMTDHYTAHEVTSALRENAGKFRRFLGDAQRAVGVA